MCSSGVNVYVQTADYLAILCINICRVVDLDVLIFGGGMSAAGEPLLERIRAHMQRRRWTIFPENVKVVLSGCRQEEAGILGAALAVVQTAQKDKDEKEAAAAAAAAAVAAAELATENPAAVLARERREREIVSLSRVSW